MEGTSTILYIFNIDGLFCITFTWWQNEAARNVHHSQTPVDRIYNILLEYNRPPIENTKVSDKSNQNNTATNTEILLGEHVKVEKFRLVPYSDSDSSTGSPVTDHTFTTQHSKVAKLPSLDSEELSDNENERGCAYGSDKEYLPSTETSEDYDEDNIEDKASISVF